MRFINFDISNLKIGKEWTHAGFPGCPRLLVWSLSAPRTSGGCPNSLNEVDLKYKKVKTKQAWPMFRNPSLEFTYSRCALCCFLKSLLPTTGVFTLSRKVISREKKMFFRTFMRNTKNSICACNVFSLDQESKISRTGSSCCFSACFHSS